MLLCQHMAFSSWLGRERKFAIAMNPRNAGEFLRRAFSLEKNQESGLPGLSLAVFRVDGRCPNRFSRPCFQCPRLPMGELYVREPAPELAPWLGKLLLGFG